MSDVEACFAGGAAASGCSYEAVGVAADLAVVDVSCLGLLPEKFQQALGMRF